MGSLVTGLAWGQTSLPNSNMETWGTAANGTDSLAGWSSSNSVVIPPVVSLRKDTLAHEGTYAAHVITAPFGFVQYTTIGALANGKAVFTYGGGGGGANVEYGGGGGTPIVYKPTELRGFYLYNTLVPADGDQGAGYVLLSKYNTTLNRRDTVSYGEHYFEPNDIYAPFTISLVDHMPSVVPDSITVLFYSSNINIVPPNDAWSDLWLDKLSLFPAPNLSKKDPDLSPWITLYPNPCTDFICISKQAEVAMVCEVFDNAGRQLLTTVIQPHEPQYMLDVSGFAAGTYHIKCVQNGRMQAQKFVIQSR